SLVTMVASFLPWLDTAIGSFVGTASGGLWTFYAAALALPGVIWRSRPVVMAHALVLAVAAIAVPAWRFVWALQRLPGLGEAWLPSPGMLLVFISGVVAAVAVTGLVPAAARRGAGPRPAGGELTNV